MRRIVVDIATLAAIGWLLSVSNYLWTARTPVLGTLWFVEFSRHVLPTASFLASIFVSIYCWWQVFGLVRLRPLMRMLLVAGTNLVLIFLLAALMYGLQKKGVEAIAQVIQVLHQIPEDLAEPGRADVAYLFTPIIRSPVVLSGFLSVEWWLIPAVLLLISAGIAGMVLAIVPSRWRIRDRHFKTRSMYAYVALSLAAGACLVLAIEGPEIGLNLSRMLVDPSRPNIVVISLDTARADRFGFGGGVSDATPFLDQRAAEGIVFENAIAQSSWTLPTHASMLSGLHPVEHKVHPPFGRLLDSEVLTLPEILAEEGYETGAITSVHFLTAAFGMDQGFGTMAFANEDSPGRIDKVLEFWRELDPHRPHFTFVHLFDAHDPYVPADDKVRSGVREALEHTRNGNLHELVREAIDGQTRSYLLSLYDSELSVLDMQIERMLNNLPANGRKTLIVVIGDHGEGFGEHNHYGHGVHLYRESVQVPWLIWWHGGPSEPVRVRTPVAASIALAPTILEIVDLPLPASMKGRGVLANVRDARNGSPGDTSMGIVSESYHGFGKISLTGDSWQAGAAILDGKVRPEYSWIETAESLAPTSELERYLNSGIWLGELQAYVDRYNAVPYVPDGQRAAQERWIARLFPKPVTLY